MCRRIGSTLVLCLLVFAAGRTFGQVSQSGLISPTDAGRAGLKRAWYTHIEVDRAKGRLAYITQFVSPTKSTTLFEIKHDGGEMVISEKHLDPFGIPWGKEGAKNLAQEKVEELKKLGQNPKVTGLTVPDITLYVASDRGVVQAIDGETGRTRWALPIGKMNHPTLEPAASDRYVAIVNGSSLYVLSAADGKLVWQRQLKGAPGAGGAITADLVHVPMINGMMESYQLTNQKMGASLYKSHGRAMIQPIATDRSVCWSTNRGHVYFGYADKPGVRFRLETGDAVVARPTYKAPNFVYVASLDGYLYCAHELNGDVLWRFSAGEPISHRPLVMDESVFIVTDYGNLFRVSAINGSEKWSTPRVKSILGGSKDRLYCSGDGDKFLVIDANTGAKLGSFDGHGVDLRFNNVQTDRIFVGSSTGVIQCLHQTTLKYPVVHSGLGGEIKEKPKVQQKGLKPGEGEAGEEGEMPKEPDVEDPFGAGEKKDPEGEDPAMEKPEEDPADAPPEDPKPKESDDDPFG